MSFATAVTWLFNFVLAITFPLLLNAFKPQGAFGWVRPLPLSKWKGSLMMGGDSMRPGT